MNKIIQVRMQATAKTILHNKNCSLIKGCTNCPCGTSIQRCRAGMGITRELTPEGIEILTRSIEST